MRALAVVLVMATHFGLHATQGQVGVDVFFVLSGFLITSLLLRERDRTGQVSLRNFWRRRALRLLPALGCALVLAVVLSLATAAGMRHATFAAVPFVVAYVGNWHMALGPPHAGGLVAHAWSLGVEEQFYILWPLIGAAWLCATTNRARAARVVTWLAVADGLYFLLALGLWSPSRAIFATDTHGFGLLAGSALALWAHRDGPVAVLHGPVARRLHLAGGAAAVAIVALACFGGIDLVILPATVAAVALVASLVLVEPGMVATAFAWAPMQWIGRRSYGIYLYHFPLAVAFVEGRQLHGLHEAAVVGGCVVVSLVLAAASYRWVETPFLARKDRWAAAPVLRPAAAGALS